jgi:nardilysin
MPIASATATADADTIGNGNDDHDYDILDLTGSRPKMDKKLYRHITLPNGLQCVLICDTVALRRRRAMGACDSGGGGRYDSDSEDDDESELGGDAAVPTSPDIESNSDNNNNDDDDDDDDGDDDDDYDEDGIRKAATALLVNVGSYHDPPYCQGLAHFLEHMLFLGTELYPQENAYDAFLSKMGGDDNAYTGT